MIATIEFLCEGKQLKRATLTSETRVPLKGDRVMLGGDTFEVVMVTRQYFGGQGLILANIFIELRKLA